MNQAIADATAIDAKLSNRHIELDPGGYFIIYLDNAAGMICAKHYTNIINERGVACDPETGNPLPCNGKIERIPVRTYMGRTAKAICVQLFEETQPCPVTMFDHAAYLGREFQRAEFALLHGQEYVQD